VLEGELGKVNYEEKVIFNLSVWERKLFQPPGLLERTSKVIGNRVNHLIPKKVHQVITAAVKTIIRTTLFGVEYTPKRKVQTLSLEVADTMAKEAQTLYQKIAVAEGAGTGAGGIMLSMVDFPALIAIKMKFLFELAHIYGFDTKHFSERIFILYVFQLTYSGHTSRKQILDKIKHWDNEKQQWASDTEYYKKLDWDTFQMEYRDAIDFRKILQMVPGIGAVAGAWANYSIMDELGEVAMNAYRIRRLLS
jgi:uncharacterized protein (DUF697 family)